MFGREKENTVIMSNVMHLAQTMRKQLFPITYVRWLSCSD